MLSTSLTGKDNPTGHSERKKKKRQTKEKVGKQYQRVDRNGLPAQLEQLKTGQDGKGLLPIHLWCPDDLPELWDRTEQPSTKSPKRNRMLLQLICKKKKKKNGSFAPLYTLYPILFGHY